MDILVRALLFFAAAWLLWFFAGVLIEAVSSVARRHNRSSFTVAFFVLGFLTSIGEFAVMVSSSLSGAPQVAVGNLIGTSIILLLLTIPLLAILGGEVRLKNAVTRKQLIVALLVIVLPALVIIDGDVTKQEGILCLLSYGALAYLIEQKRFSRRRKDSVSKIFEDLERELSPRRKTSHWDLLRVLIGAIFIFLAAWILVDETVFFSEFWGVPSSIIGLLILPLGTNLAELVIAVRAIGKGSMDIAFGDYLGSAVAKTVIFAILAIWQGTFYVVMADFYAPIILLVVGSVCFYFFARSKDSLSRTEGIILFIFYILFLLSQFFSFWIFALH